jgi:rhodanese-related sulfurtransferase
VHLHFQAVEELADALLPDRDALIVTYCSNAACQNSRIAAAKLDTLGYTDVRRPRSCTTRVPRRRARATRPGKPSVRST